MSNRIHKPFRQKDTDLNRPVCIGTGFLALDRLLIGKNRVRANKHYAGGSCGNVIAILAYLDWNSYAVARLGTDSQAELVINDLESCSVNTSFVAKEAKGVTPVIIIRVSQNANGTYQSRFEWKDPKSGEWLPRYRPLPKKYASKVIPELPKATAFYFDRAEPGSLALANAMREKGALVFFEPSSCKDDLLFTACLAVSDIVKYSAERIPKPPRNPASKSPRLEIQTLGAKGLRYRLKNSKNLPGPWRVLPGFSISDQLDATGAGDWCSAGILDMLCSNGRQHFLNQSESAIVCGIRFGQALAAINCEFEGARGPMYQLIPNELIARAERLFNRNGSGPTDAPRIRVRSSTHVVKHASETD